MVITLKYKGVWSQFEATPSGKVDPVPFAVPSFNCIPCLTLNVVSLSSWKSLFKKGNTSFTCHVDVKDNETGVPVLTDDYYMLGAQIEGDLEHGVVSAYTLSLDPNTLSPVLAHKADFEFKKKGNYLYARLGEGKWKRWAKSSPELEISLLSLSDRF